MHLPSNNSNTIATRASAPADALPRSAGGSKNLQADILHRKRISYVACWNVRTLKSTEAQALTIHALYKYGIEIACLSEVRLPNSGHMVIPVAHSNTSYHLYHSGVSDDSGRHGVAVALSANANAALLDWEPISERLARIRLKGSIFNITVIAVYAPTRDADDTTKNDFYEDLQNLVRQVPSSDMLIVAGDWNARAGKSDGLSQGAVGKFGLGDRCTNGDRMVNFATSNKLVLTNTRFDHPVHHITTWYSNDGRTSSQIDYIMVRSRWSCCVLDSRVFRGAETGNLNGSDHMLVRAKLRLRLKSLDKLQPVKKLDVGKLRCGATAAKFQVELSNRFEGLPLLDRESPPEEHWEQFKSHVRDVAHKELGGRRPARKEWISPDTITLVEKTRDARNAGNPDFKSLRRQAARSARSDLNKYWQTVAAEMEQAASVGDSRKLYQLLKSTTKGNGCRNETLLDANGVPISHLADRTKRWKQHFETLLNHEPPSQRPPSDIMNAPTYDANCEPPTEDEIREAIKKLKNNKASGEDGLPAEIYKSCPDLMARWLHRILGAVWHSEKVPQDWSDSILLPFFKKGDRRVCSNYRGISLIDVASKIFSVVLLRRFQSIRDQRTRPNQAGFRRGRGCVDQIFSLRRILEQRWCYQQSSVVCFIDFSAAFDSIDRESLWGIMRRDGFPEKLLNLIKAYYAQTRSKVRCYGEESDFFDICTGVRQGCVLSPILFNYIIDWILEHSLADFAGMRAGLDCPVTDLDFADDVATLGESYADVQHALTQINQTAKLVGMKINASKTKVLSANIPPAERLAVTLNGETVEEVEQFKYLGATFTATGQGKDEIAIRISRARAAFVRLQRRLWSRQEIKLSTKARIYQALARTILLYGCETWPLRKEDLHQLDVFDHFCLRRILRVRLSDRIPNAAIRARCKILSLEETLLKRRLRWFGHVLRRPDEEIVRKLVAPNTLPGWKKRRGGQLKTWLATVKADMGLVSGPRVFGVRRWNREWLDHAEDAAADRRGWAALTRDAVNSFGAGSTHPG